MTYATLNAVFVGGALIRAATLRRPPTRAFWITLLALLLLTAIFDNVIIGLGIVTYDPSKLLGAYVGLAPVEDFCYPLVAALLVPVLWNKPARTRQPRGING